MSFSTPSTGHLREPEFDSVYEPAEDSFLFLDALQHDWDAILKLRPTVCLEIGSGSGIVSTFIAQNLSTDAECFMMCIDINPAAASATRKTFNNNISQRSAVFDTALCNLANVFLPICRGAVDLILFNPPYVVTLSEELASGDLTSKAWAGGENGREVMDKFFPQAAKLLSPDGLIYLVALRENNIEDIARTVATYGLQTTVVLTRRCRNELLHIIRFSRQTE